MSAKSDSLPKENGKAYKYIKQTKMSNCIKKNTHNVICCFVYLNIQLKKLFIKAGIVNSF